MTLSEKQFKFTFNISLLITFAWQKGFALTFGEVYRTLEQQKIYFDSGRSKTMNSRHLQRLAVDFNIFKRDNALAPWRMMFQDKALLIADLQAAQVLGDYWMSLNTENVWGGDWDRDNDVLDETFRDPYHFEMKP
jgi:hypothetical protein